MTKNIAYLEWTLDITCPGCKRIFDLGNSGNDDEGEISIPIFNNDWDKLKGKRVICPECDKDFIISEVIY